MVVVIDVSRSSFAGMRFYKRVTGEIVTPAKTSDSTPFSDSIDSDSIANANAHANPTERTLDGISPCIAPIFLKSVAFVGWDREVLLGHSQSAPQTLRNVKPQLRHRPHHPQSSTGPVTYAMKRDVKLKEFPFSSQSRIDNSRVPSSHEGHAYPGD